MSINPDDVAAVPRANSKWYVMLWYGIVRYGVPRANGMPRNVQSAADECTDRAIHVIHKSHKPGLQQLLAYIVPQGRAYASEIASNGLNMWDTCAAAQDFWHNCGALCGRHSWQILALGGDNAPRGIAANT